MRLCIIGDSHCAALHKGWEGMLAGRYSGVCSKADPLSKVSRLTSLPPHSSSNACLLSTPQHPTLNIDWFASPGKTMNGLAVENGALVPNTPNLIKFLRLSTGEESPRIVGGDYNRYLVYGLQFSPSLHVPALASQRAEHTNDAKFVSDLVAVLMETIAAVTVRKLKRIVGLNTYIVLEAAPLSTAQGDHRAGRFAALWWEAASQVAQKLGVHYAPQPAETLSGPFSTKSEFAKAPSYPELDGVDGQHMNADFGEAVMRAALLSCHACGPSLR